MGLGGACVKERLQAEGVAGQKQATERREGESVFAFSKSRISPFEPKHRAMPTCCTPCNMWALYLVGSCLHALPMAKPTLKQIRNDANIASTTRSKQTLAHKHALASSLSGRCSSALQSWRMSTSMGFQAGLRLLSMTCIKPARQALPQGQDNLSSGVPARISSSCARYFQAKMLATGKQSRNFYRVS